MSSDIATNPPSSGPVPTQAELKEVIAKRANSALPGTFANLLSSPNAEVLESREVVSKDDKPKLIGLTFAITSIRFSKGTFKFMPDVTADFVSLEVVTIDDRLMVINDGSTGIRRQMVNWIADKGWIDCGQPISGISDSAYDKPASLWAVGEDAAYAGFDIGDAPYLILNGLRVSSYDTENGPAETFYLA